MTNPDMMTNMVKQSVGGFLPQVRPSHTVRTWYPADSPHVDVMTS